MFSLQRHCDLKQLFRYHEETYDLCVLSWLPLSSPFFAFKYLRDGLLNRCILKVDKAGKRVTLETERRAKLRA